MIPKFAIAHSAIIGRMTTPIRATSDAPRTKPLAPPAAVSAPALAGVGAAPTRLEPTANTHSPGYFEKCVVGLKNLVVAFFRWLFRRVDDLKVAAQPTPSDPRMAQAKKLLAQLSTGVMPFNLQTHFAEIFSEKEQLDIHRALGASVPFAATENWTCWTQVSIDTRNTELGRTMAKQNPVLLVPYLIPQLQKITA